MKFDEITIDEIGASTTALFDQQNNPLGDALIVFLYRDGKEVGSVIGRMKPIEENQRIPAFIVDFPQPQQVKS